MGKIKSQDKVMSGAVSVTDQNISKAYHFCTPGWSGDTSKGVNVELGTYGGNVFYSKDKIK